MSMNQVEINIVLGIVSVAGTFWAIKKITPFIGRLWNKLGLASSKTEEAKASGDTLPPAGFTEHIAIIRSASHAASADVREIYYEKGLTFTETLQAEYNRVAKEEADLAYQSNIRKYTIAYYCEFGPYDTATYISHALEEMGHKVIKLDMNLLDMPECDFRLFTKLECDWLIKNSKEPTVCWQFDLHRNFGNRSFDLPCFKADIVVTTDGGDPYHTVRQGIHKPHKIMYSDEKIYEAIFVGDPYSNYREDLIKRLRLKLITDTRGLALNKLLAQTKIVVGDSAPSDNYWSNRLYEITGRGGFLIHPVTIGMPYYIPQYRRGKEQDVIDYFLKNEEEREMLRQVQFMSCPTYHDRVKEFLEIIDNEI